MYKNESRGMDMVCYDEVQESLGKAEYERNLCERRKVVKACRQWTLKRRDNNPFTFIAESGAVNDTTEAHHLI